MPPSCILVATMCLMSLLAALLTKFQALLISFAVVILLSQLLRQELCLLGEGGGPGLLAQENLETQTSVLYKLPRTKTGCSDSGGDSSEPSLVLNKPCYSASPSAMLFASFRCHGFCNKPKAHILHLPYFYFGT